MDREQTRCPAFVPGLQEGKNHASSWPSIRVAEEGQNLIVQVELPRMSADQLDFSMVDDGLTIHGRHSSPLEEPPADASARTAIIGSSSRLLQCLETSALAAGCEANVLLTGETGTGKELFARVIHESSHRHQGPLAVVDCTSLPKELVESLLFGHDKGSFTHADTCREGLIRQAHGGTLFLDEIGELPLSVQKVFLRVLEEHRFRPIGAEQEVTSDFRLVAATNRDLDEMVRKGQFRADLLFRLKAFLIDLPPLRQRLGDIRELTLYHLSQLCCRHDIRHKRVSSDFIGPLSRYDWPGNVRELVNVLEHALFAAKHEATLFAKHLPSRLRAMVLKKSLQPRTIGKPDLSHFAAKDLPSLQEFRASIFCQAETRYLQDLMALANQNVRFACQLSGLSRSRLYALLKKHHINNLQ